jgi:hypothetical protein
MYTVSPPINPQRYLSSIEILQHRKLNEPRIEREEKRSRPSARDLVSLVMLEVQVIVRAKVMDMVMAGAVVDMEEVLVATAVEVEVGETEEVEAGAARKLPHIFHDNVVTIHDPTEDRRSLAPHYSSTSSGTEITAVPYKPLGHGTAYVQDKHCCIISSKERA